MPGESRASAPRRPLVLRIAVRRHGATTRRARRAGSRTRSARRRSAARARSARTASSSASCTEVRRGFGGPSGYSYDAVRARVISVGIPAPRSAARAACAAIGRARMPASVASLTGPITDAASWPTSNALPATRPRACRPRRPFDPLHAARSRRPSSPPVGPTGRRARRERPLAELVQKRGDLLQVVGHRDRARETSRSRSRSASCTSRAAAPRLRPRGSAAR